MKCYICGIYSKESFHVLGVDFGACEKHKEKVLFGVIKFKLTGNLEVINELKDGYKKEETCEEEKNILTEDDSEDSDSL